jgi:glycosyltransferase involved in cell wall biosynthesis
MRRKNIAVLARVAPDLPWPVYVAGDDTRPGSGEAGSLSCESPVNQLRPLGRLDQARLADLLARAAVYALPARYEPFGLGVLEAGLAGCALILGDIPSLREVWGDAALFVHPDDTDGLRDALQYLMTHPDGRDDLAMRARARALTFSPRRMVDGYLAAYHRLLTRAKTAGTPAAVSPGLTTCP